jgi:tryptophanyl-tRNA synthetase
MLIVTDSTPLEEPKNPDTCNVFAIYSLLAEKDQIQQLRDKYLGGNYGYGHAKQELFELILEKFKNERELFRKFMDDTRLLEEELQKGEEKARTIGSTVLDKVRKKIGYK